MRLLRLAAFLVVSIVAAFTPATPARAAVLSFGADAYGSTAGGALWLPVEVRGLATDPTREFVTAFDLDVLYDPGILEFRGIEFDAALGTPEVDALTGAFATPGRIDFSAVSLLSNAELQRRQSVDVPLARLLFAAIGIGATTLTFDTVAAPGALLVGGDPFAPLALERLGTAVVTVGAPAQVPEPGALALLLLALAALVSTRRRRRSSAVHAARVPIPALAVLMPFVATAVPFSLAALALLVPATASASAATCDVDADRDVDRLDVAAIHAARNQPASGPADPRDANRDGVITILDARVCVLACTLPACAEPPPNRAPQANAGADQNVYAGATVTLNGSASNDPDGDALAFLWTLRARPAGSAAVLDATTAVMPTFVADVEGRYDLELRVADARGASATDTVTVVTAVLNTAPVADAGPDLAGTVGVAVTLDGTASADVDGDPLAYAWSVRAAPAGSLAQPASPTAARASFVPDLVGTYAFELRVADGRGGESSDVAELQTSPANRAPIANAGPDRSAGVRIFVRLDGTASSDPDADPLLWRWSFVARPAGSTATLDDPASPTPGFTTDRDGDYVVQLVVGDGRLDSAPDTVLISSRNTPPVADAGPDLQVELGGVAELDGRGSRDAEGDALTYAWSLTATPPASAASIDDDVLPLARLQPDVPGLYVVQLVVADGIATGAPDTATIEVAAPATVVTVVAIDDRAAELGGDIGRFRIARTGDTRAALVVTLRTAGSATEGVDYAALGATATIAAGAASVDVAVRPITDADDAEGTESAILLLAPGNDYTVGAPGSASVTITDRWSVSIVAIDADAAEAGLDGATFRISRTGDDLTRELLVGLTASGTANDPLSPPDTLPVPQLVTIPVGVADVTLVVRPVADNLVEGAESLTLSIAPNPNYVIGSASSATAAIADDPPVVTLTAAAATATEAGLVPGRFAFERTGGNPVAPLTARCTLGGTAANSADYVFTGCSAVFAAGQTRVELEIRPQADNRVEGAETVVATLLATPAYAVGMPDAATVTLVDDPPVVTVAAPDASAAESGDPAGFELRRSGGDVSGAIPVPLVWSGTATRNVDYTGAPTQVTIAAGASTATVAITPRDDVLVEGTETVVLSLGASASFVPGAPSTGTATIADDDP